jgi:hypothetical protein
VKYKALLVNPDDPSAAQEEASPFVKQMCKISIERDRDKAG